MKMQILQFMLYTIVLCHTCVKASSMLGWIWGSEDSENQNKHMILPVNGVPFEMLTQDDKFLIEAGKLLREINLDSLLESCQHRVVLKLKLKCGELSEENLARFSIDLFNCKALSEDKQIIDCNESMAVKDCTSNLHPELYNSLILTNNRARAVCYDVRNQHFRALTEMTIAKLLKSTHFQIESLTSLENSYNHIGDQAKDIQKLMEENMQKLDKEKDIISNSNAELIALTENLRAKLGIVDQEIQHNTKVHRHSAKEILEDLKNIELQTSIVLDKIESSTFRIIDQNNDLVSIYDGILLKFEKINSSVFHMWNSTSIIHADIIQKLEWFSSFINIPDIHLTRTMIIIQHVIYLIAGMVVTSFLDLSLLVRFALVILTSLNLVIFTKHQSDAMLDFTSITVLLIFFSIIQCSIHVLHFFGRKITQTFDSRKDEHIFIRKYPNVEDSYSTLYKYEPVTKPKLSLLTRMKNEVVYQWRALNNSIRIFYGKICKAFTKVISILLPTLYATEERSCSYEPSKKLNQRLQQLPNISEDFSDSSGEFEEDDTDRRNNLETSPEIGETFVSAVNTHRKNKSTGTRIANSIANSTKRISRDLNPEGSMRNFNIDIPR